MPKKINFQFKAKKLKPIKKSPKKITKPITKPIPPETHTHTGWVHRYWARKPWNVVREYIQHFTNEGDIVLDPFCGSGVTISEGLILGRRTIGIDLNPIAIFISNCVCSGPIDVGELETEFQRIIKIVTEKTETYYNTTCPTCHKIALVKSTVWDGDRPTHHFIRCDECKYNGIKPIDSADIDLLKQIDSIPKEQIKRIYPYPEDVIKRSSNVKTVDQLFSKRNLICICHLKNEIEKIKNKSHRDLLNLTFSASLEPMSKLPPVRESRFSKDVSPAGSWYKKTGYWVPPRHVDGNVLFYFSERFQKIIRAKMETNETIGAFYSAAKSYEDMVDSDKTTLLLVGDATKMELPDECVHYIHTDPPYGGAVPYLLSSTMWNSWLGESPLWDDEIVIESPGDVETYKKKIIEAFQEMHRVLKPGGHLSIWFHYRDPDIWFALLGAARYVGFEKISLVQQKHAKKSSEQGDSPTSTIKEDWLVTFKKSAKGSKYLVINGGYNIVEINEFVKEHTANILAEVPRGQTYDEIYNKLLKIMIDKGIHHKVEPIVSEGSPKLKHWGILFS